MKYRNNAASVLASPITAVATSLSVAPGTGANFPTDDFLATLIGYDGLGNENAWEIVYCSSRTGDVLTIQRGREGTTAAAWPGATRIENRVTAGTLDGLLEKAGGVMTGDIEFSGIGRRIRGLMSTASAIVDRLLFQSSTANGSTDLSVIPNGTSTRSGFGALNSSDTTNHSFLTMLALAAEARIWSGKSGTGTVIPLTFYVDNTERVRIDVNGNFGIGLVPTDGRGILQASRAVTGGAPAATGSTDANQVATLGSSNASLRFGLYASGAAWLQASQASNYAVNYDLALAPNGGRIGIGVAPVARLDVNGNQASNIVAVGALDIDCSQGNFFVKTINANSTFTFSNPPASRAFAFVLEVVHTSGSITFPASVRWPNNTAPTLTTGRVHLFVFVTDDAGTTWRGNALANYTS